MASLQKYVTTTKTVLIHPPSASGCKNVLLIDSAVKDFNLFASSVNESTFPITYSTRSSKTDLLAVLQTNFTSIDRIGIVFSSNVFNETQKNSKLNANMGRDSKRFLDGKPFFGKEAANNENVDFLVSVIKQFGVKNIDFLGCNTLKSDTWNTYYSNLTKETGVLVGASKDQTGNVQYGGDWVMESTSQDIQLIYFTKNIEYYTYLLDNPVNWQALKLVWNNDPNVFGILVLDTANTVTYLDEENFPEFVLSFKLSINGVLYNYLNFLGGDLVGFGFEYTNPLTYSTSNMISQFTDINVFSNNINNGPYGIDPFTFQNNNTGPDYVLTSVHLLNNPPLLRNFRIDYTDGVYVLLTIDINNYYDFLNFIMVPPIQSLPSWLISFELYYSGSLQYTLGDLLYLAFESPTNYPFSDPPNLIPGPPPGFAFGTYDENIYATVYNIMLINSLDLVLFVTSVQLANICFPANTPIQTDQGIVAIQKINPNIHTINNKAIVDITKTITPDKYLVCFSKDALGPNYPTKQTIMSKEHKVFYNGQMIEAKKFVDKFINVFKVEYSGEVLYNVLMEEHYKMRVNNLICETLDPKHYIAQLYTRKSKYTEEQKKQLLDMLKEREVTIEKRKKEHQSKPVSIKYYK
jgi:hypothetical protein